ncbi:MAG TPA: Gmad2 immunoglobulin-like domain-containing protein [Candidatus Paceibacterota bacterium]|nr:Gmad2 immunoglobulin-like domain-containing protein [Candidatus Paceibacterota bacterium]
MKRILTVIVVAAAAAAGVWLLKGAPSPAPSATPLADDVFILDEPLPGAVVSSPLTIRGKARGTWFFEASFPVTLTNWDGLIIAQHYCMTAGEWMTTEFVGFECELEFTRPDGPGDGTNRGFLILHKDNPSGLPEHDDSREIMIHFE